MCRFEKQAKEIMEAHRMAILKHHGSIPFSAETLLKGAGYLLKEILTVEAEGIGFDEMGFQKRLTKQDKEFLRSARHTVDGCVDTAAKVSGSWARRKEV
jgi:hypothetical protein